MFVVLVVLVVLVVVLFSDDNRDNFGQLVFNVVMVVLVVVLIFDDTFRLTGYNCLDDHISWVAHFLRIPRC